MRPKAEQNHPAPIRPESISLLDGLTAMARASLLSRAVERRFAAGEVLWREGGEPQGIFVVLEGRVRVVRTAAGRQNVIHHEESGGTLGEVPFFAGGRYPATAMAAEPTRCLVLNREAVLAVIATDPALAWHFLARLARRTRDLVERVDALASRSATSRLAAYVLDRAERAGALDTRHTFTLGSSQTALAEELGTVREVVVRGLRALRESGALISAGRGLFRVAEARALKEMAQRE